MSFFITTQKIFVYWVIGVLNQKMLMMKQGESTTTVRKTGDEGEEYITK